MVKNYEAIKKMSLEELAKFLNHTDCGICAYHFTDKCFSMNGMRTNTCTKGIKEWLNLEYK
ncbi:hypothetical protein KTC96_25000 (plasmid) [Clostridium estertheticum]|uniref:hypothetical protein n=1 Tax=Clostridium estertheticum TaxID=238834 RepID=UPI001C7D4489|nr:hypothetical protein [Clostridium estertheticum]MBX4259788.1 hypothetical protein [Clostridium estertheticum]WLC73280.1 hypothetical protein KTC96_25000 [Clostridium estertheticum]